MDYLIFKIIKKASNINLELRHVPLKVLIMLMFLIYKKWLIDQQRVNHQDLINLIMKCLTDWDSMNLNRKLKNICKIKSLLRMKTINKIKNFMIIWKEVWIILTLMSMMKTIFHKWTTGMKKKNMIKMILIKLRITNKWMTLNTEMK